MSEHWISKLKTDHTQLKKNFALQALANYIVLTMLEHEIEELLPMLQDPTKQVHVEIYVTDRKDTP